VEKEKENKQTSDELEKLILKTNVGEGLREIIKVYNATNAPLKWPPITITIQV
jgi:hypothetical protein